MELYTPAQLEALTGLAVANQSAWRTNGLMKGRGQQTKGGHWRFTKRDVLYVATVRVLSERGFGLEISAMLAGTPAFLLEVLAAAQRLPYEPGQPKYFFAWRRADCTFEAEDALAKDGYIHFKRWTEGDKEAVLLISQSSEWCSVQTSYLDSDLPRLSRAGGIIIVPEQIGWNIPPVVADLFKTGAAE